LFPYREKKRGHSTFPLLNEIWLGQNRAVPRTARASVGEICYHVINRGNARQQVFQKQGDYQAFVELIGLACEHIAMRVLRIGILDDLFYD